MPLKLRRLFPGLEYDLVIEPTDLGQIIAQLLELLVAIPTSDQQDGETIYSDNGVLKVSSVQGN
jgi:hypothetical protein